MDSIQLTGSAHDPAENTAKARGGAPVQPAGREVLILGENRWGLSVARSLHRAGHGVTLVHDSNLPSTRHSRAVKESWRHPPYESPDFAPAFSDFLRQRPEIDLIIPLGDNDLTALAMNQIPLPESAEYFGPSDGTLRLCLDKAAMCALADELAIPQAKFVIAHDLASLQDAYGAVGFPCLVKPTDQLARINGEKAVILHGEEDVARYLPEWPEGNDNVFVQRYVTGPRHNLHFIARHGQLLTCAETRALRTTRVNYTGYTVEAITVAPDPDLQDYTERLVRDLGYHGFGCAQFLVDPAAESPVSFLELNPRLGAAFAVTLASGIDLPAAALRLTEEGGKAVEPYAAGRRMAWIYGDLLGLVRALQCREIGPAQTALWLARCARSLWRADIHATWSWADPLPSLALATQWIPRRFRRWSGTEQQSQV
ncbi:MAG: hypothetical protein AAGI72_01225 [Pseudomonadota bacterium]